MRKLFSRIFIILSLFIELSTLCSCKNDDYVILTDKLKYFETPQNLNLGQINRQSQYFKPMNKEQREDFYSFITDSNNVVWLKIDFVIPAKYRHKDLALYIPQLHSASRLYLNDRFVRQYGTFPPNELSSGFQSQIFLFPKEMFNSADKNTILIECWPGAIGCIYGDIYLGFQEPLLRKAEITNYFNSRSILIITSILVVMFLIYIFLYFVTTKTEISKEYLYSALTLFYTIHFLVPFILPEVTWLKIQSISYLTYLKFFFGFGGISTIYFANSFILSYIGTKPTIKNTSPRLVLWFISSVGIFLIPDYATYKQLTLIYFCISLLQFCYTIPVLIKSLLDSEKQKRSTLLLLSFTPVLISVIVDIIIRFVFHNNTTPFFTIYGWQCTILIFLSFLLVRFSNLYIHNADLSSQLSDMNTHLEEIVNIRTKELSNANFNLMLGLDTVSKVQQNFLPRQTRAFKGWDLAIYYKALDHEVSGDLYDYYDENGSLKGVGLFDVSGHGISAGLMTILAKGIISQQFLNGINNGEPLSDVLQEINTTYIKEKVNIENYITGLLFHFDFIDNDDICSVELANAGHPYPLMYNNEKDSITELKHSDLKNQYGFLGVDGLKVSFPSLYFTTKQNDIIVCYTDGLTESKNAEGEEFGKERVMQIITENKNKTAEIIKEEIKIQLDKFMQNSNTDDDISFIVLKRTSLDDYIEEI